MRNLLIVSLLFCSGCSLVHPCSRPGYQATVSCLTLMLKEELKTNPNLNKRPLHKTCLAFSNCVIK